MAGTTCQENEAAPMLTAQEAIEKA